jgi:hypothetical protein
MCAGVVCSSQRSVLIWCLMIIATAICKCNEIKVEFNDIVFTVPSCHFFLQPEFLHAAQPAIFLKAKYHDQRA